MPVQDNAHGTIGAAVSHQNDIATQLTQHAGNGLGLVIECPRRALGVPRVETRQGQGRGQGTCGGQLLDHLVPGPGAKPIPGDKDDVRLPLWSRPGPGGGYGLLSGGALPPVSLTDAQALSLLAAVAAAPDAPYSDLAAAAVRKIMDVLDPNTRARVDQLASRVWVNPAATVSRVIRSACEQAMTEQRVLRIDYVAADGAATRRDVEPILFANTNGTWYLIGWCRLRDAVRWFLVSRIRRASVTREPCTGHTVAESGTPPPTATSVRINRG